MLTDYTIDGILIKWCNEAGVDFRKTTYQSERIISSTEETYKIKIYTYHPGLLIGMMSRLYNKYEKEFEKDAKTKVNIEFVKVKEIQTEKEWREHFHGMAY